MIKINLFKIAKKLACPFLCAILLFSSNSYADYKAPFYLFLAPAPISSGIDANAICDAIASSRGAVSHNLSIDSRGNATCKITYSGSVYVGNGNYATTENVILLADYHCVGGDIAYGLGVPVNGAYAFGYGNDTMCSHGDSCVSPKVFDPYTLQCAITGDFSNALPLSTNKNSGKGLCSTSTSNPFTGYPIMIATGNKVSSVQDYEFNSALGLSFERDYSLSYSERILQI